MSLVFEDTVSYNATLTACEKGQDCRVTIVRTTFPAAAASPARGEHSPPLGSQICLIP